MEITKLFARTILDSRGNPTVEVDCFVNDNFISRAAVPSGASTGAYEAIELRDGGENWGGKGVSLAVANINDMISKELVGFDLNSPNSQIEIDEILLELDGTENKSNLGANAMLGVSMACLKASAKLNKNPNWRHISNLMGTTPSIPIPMMNILNGGAHASSDVDIQEFMVIPHGFSSFSDALRAGTECYHSLKLELKRDGLITGIGDEGGFAPNLPTNEHGLEYMVRAIEGAGYSTEEIGIALDVAATEFYSKDGYKFDKKKSTGEELVEIYEGWIEKYPLLSIEDPFDEDDWESWNLLTKNCGDQCQIVGDDLYVTQTKRLEKGINLKSSNSILIKLNQVGTVTETFETLKLAWNADFKTIISHRSGETSDAIIADLATGSGAGQIKTGAPARSDRTSKYNQLLRISESVTSYFNPFS
ncbi:MAG: phosphopyruvate hydratase [Euryarchaeota archaeon]|nr:phosphopyruvate hydratase [Euryarchaeota archaeon]|tara:strand:+ start:1481 stop:2740 length:1260 start_codon:yes stop_codon:yes gene_type:complete